MSTSSFDSPALRPVSFLLAPDWKCIGEPWRELLIAFYRTFSSSEGVSLVMPYDPESDDVAAIETCLAEVAEAAGLTLDAIADTTLHPTPCEPQSWRALARCVTAVLVPPGAADWLVDLATPLLIDPSQETLRAFCNARAKLVTSSLAARIQVLSPKQRDLVESFMTLLALQQAEIKLAP